MHESCCMPGRDFSVSGNQTLYHTSTVQGAGHSQTTLLQWFANKRTVCDDTSSSLLCPQVIQALTRPDEYAGRFLVKGSQRVIGKLRVQRR